MKTTHVYCHTDFLERPKRNDLFEEREQIISSFCVWEICHGCVPWPRNNGNQEDTDDDGTADAINHEEGREEPATEYTQPNRGVAEDSLGAITWQAVEIIYGAVNISQVITHAQVDISYLPGCTLQDPRGSWYRHRLCLVLSLLHRKDQY